VIRRTLARLPFGLLGGLLAVRLIDEGFGFFPDGAIEQIRGDLSIGYTAIGVVLVAPFVGSLPALWFTARTDRTGRRGVVIAGAFIAALALAGYAAAPNTSTLCLAGALWGFGGSLLVHGAELELAAERGDLKRKLRVVNLLGTVGDVLGPLLLAGVLAVGWSWRVAFWIGAAVTAVYAMSLLGVEFTPAAAPDEADADDPAWRDPIAWRLGAVAFFLMPFDETWLAFLIASLQADRGWTGWAASLAGVVAVAGSALGFGPLAARAQHRADRTVMTAALVVATIAASMVGLVPALVAVLLGLVVNATVSLTWVTLQHAALTLRPNAAGQVMSLVAAIEHTTIVLPITLGVVADRWGLRWAFSVYLAMGAAAVAAARLRPRTSHPA
jgi:FSR family fosmidomycin resistance protein-like MFS transporter